MIRGTNPVLKAAIAVLLLAPFSAAANVDINVMNFSFSPNDVTINPGDTVTWHWVTGIHTITSGVASTCAGAGTLFDVPSDINHQTFMFTFANAGVFDFFCRIHEFMNMKGVVRVNGLTFNGTPSAGNMVNFTVSNLPPTDENLKAFVLLSITGTAPGISFGPCVPVVPVTLDQVTLLGLSVSSAFTTGPITGGTASTPTFPFPTAPPGLTVFAAAIVINLSTGGFGSVLPSTQFTTL
jgi:plastocyanin